jgi:hypothetical protein
MFGALPTRRSSRILDGLDIENDGAGGGVGRKQIEQVAEIDIDLVARRRRRRIAR